MEQRDIREYLRPGVRAHLMGIGGVSMEPLAEVLYGAGVKVSGSDMRQSEATDQLQALGIPVHIGHRPENVRGSELVIRTAAVHDDNPEIMAARAAGVPVFERSQAWGAIMRGYKNALCVAGTHGKTTTTSMCTHIALAQGVDPTVMIGGSLPLLSDTRPKGYRVGQGDTIILESCEYCNSFLSFFPTVAVILNIEEDHLDFFKDLADIQASFRKFAQLALPDGKVVLNADDPGARAIAPGLNAFTFGLEPGAECTARNLTWERGLPRFDIVVCGQTLTRVALQVPGIHNVKNALAAAAAAVCLGWSAGAVKEGLESFGGAGRRFERLGTCNGADVYDDYAHHPGEITALLNAVKPLGYHRVVCAFQPHTYTRTKALFGEFAEALKLADVAVLTDIYAARETDDLGVSSKQLAGAVPGARYCPTLNDLTGELRSMAQPGDLILLVGAGDIYRVGKDLCG